MTLEEKIIDLAGEEGLTNPEKTLSLYFSVLSKTSDLGEAIKNENHAEVKENIGDIVQTLMIIANNHNLNLATCLNTAWQEVKDRKGSCVFGLYKNSI